MKREPGSLYAAPSIFWLSVFFIAPLAIIVMYSFLAREPGAGWSGPLPWTRTGP
jgi:ABC-type spermidine/putrescine transport system permease subunit I